jgi:hypothetical protein
MINTLFPLDFYIQSKISNIDEICDVADKLAEYRTQNNKWGNGCTVETVSMDKVDWHPLLECAMSKFNEEIKWGNDIRVDCPWINFYERNSFQEIHHHKDCDFAAVIFLNSGKDFSKFFFKNRICGLIPPTMDRILNIGDAWYPEVASGDVVFFPAYTLHGVTPHNSNIIRKTLSFNIKLSQ